MAEEKKAKKVYTLEEIKFKEENKVMAILACIPVVGLILFFVEKEDQFVRYMGAQYMLLGAAQLILSIIPVIGWALSGIIGLVVVIFIIMGIVKVAKGERYDLPGLSALALKVMSSF
ncbi:DUF4870 domain-containing protein [Candidatus Dojkabacteria bacterium]|uniref:DUF4870 domain-containing protein n=1 Tax=Candidatus Dojkabacteria bacterium TaxID=2099670 RepID=A0A847VDJ6_9BACT|nr:DUF4870 domain-containing protein [Candidatus Dojkabacteria bacterium]